MTATATAFTFETASFYDALTAAALASLAVDMRTAQLVEWWNAGDVYGAAEAYVLDYAERGEFDVEIVSSEESEDSAEGWFAVDVVFFMIGGRNEAYQRFTVWCENDGTRSFIYGEW